MVCWMANHLQSVDFWIKGRRKVAATAHMHLCNTWHIQRCLHMLLTNRSRTDPHPCHRPWRSPRPRTHHRGVATSCLPRRWSRPTWTMRSSHPVSSSNDVNQTKVPSMAKLSHQPAPDIILRFHSTNSNVARLLHRQQACLCRCPMNAIRQTRLPIQAQRTHSSWL